MKRIILTGIGGSIGCHFFAHIMKNTDWHVIGIDSFRHKGLTDRINVMLNDHPDWRERLTMITHDLIAPFSPQMIESMGKIDYVINMASLSDVYASIKDPVPFIQNNVNLVINMLEMARVVKPETFIQISTDEVYGPTDGKHGLKEWSPILPSNPYAASKACQEAIAISYWRTYGVPVIITNTMNNLGQLQQSDKFPVMIQKAIAQGKEIEIHAEPNGEIGSRSYIHSRNFADAVLYIIKNTNPHMHESLSLDMPDRYNIAGDKQLNNLELAQLIAKLMGKELKYKIVDSTINRPGHDPHYNLDDTKLRELGWNPPVPFEEALLDTVQWQAEHSEWIK
jgi:dTDP-glucose 4,6-dehydratase